jgi:hypothetical protein
MGRGGFYSPAEAIEHALELLHCEKEWRNSFPDPIEEGWRISGLSLWIRRYSQPLFIRSLFQSQLVGDWAVGYWA